MRDQPGVGGLLTAGVRVILFSIVEELLQRKEKQEMRRTTVARMFTTPLPLSLFALLLLCGVCSARTAPADPNYEGYFDQGDCSVIKGWAADRNRLNTPINVSIYAGSQLVTTVLANGSRPDVGTYLGDNGLHGFNIVTPVALRNGTAQSISVRFESTTTDLQQSPRSITCGPAAFTIPNPKITTFEIRTSSNSKSAGLATAATAIFNNTTTTNPNLSLHVEFDRNPSFYRVGEIHDINHPEQDLKNFPWQPYSPGMSFPFHLDTSKPHGTRYVFMQINSGTSESGASPAKGDSVVLAPAHIKTFVLTGQALAQFVQRAKDLGYRFSFEGPTVQGTNPCGAGGHMDPFTPGSSLITETYLSRTFNRTEPFLNPFWKITSMAPGTLAALGSPTSYQITISGPSSGRVDDPTRVIGYKRTYGVSDGGGGKSIFGLDAAPGFTCLPGALIPNDPGFDSITLEGPDDKSPADAFFDIRLIRP